MVCMLVYCTCVYSGPQKETKEGAQDSQPPSAQLPQPQQPSEDIPDYHDSLTRYAMELASTSEDGDESVSTGEGKKPAKEGEVQKDNLKQVVQPTMPGSGGPTAHPMSGHAPPHGPPGYPPPQKSSAPNGYPPARHPYSPYMYGGHYPPPGMGYYPPHGMCHPHNTTQHVM